jgi:hypothetical protein
VASAPPCTADQIEAGLFGEFGYAGHMDTPIVFRNRGAAPCSVEGFPDLTILDSADHVIARAVGSEQRGTFFGEPPVVPVILETNTPALTTSQGIRHALPRGQTQVHVEWYDCRTPIASRMTIDLPNTSGRLGVDYAISAPSSGVCGNPSAAAPVSILGRGPFTPT